MVQVLALITCIAEPTPIEDNKEATYHLLDRYRLLIDQVMGNYLETRLLSSVLKGSYAQQILVRDKYQRTPTYLQAALKYRTDSALYQKAPADLIRTCRR